MKESLEGMFNKMPSAENVSEQHMLPKACENKNKRLPFMPSVKHSNLSRQLENT